MLEKLEWLRLQEDDTLASEHFPKLFALIESIRNVRPTEARTVMQLAPLQVMYEEWSRYAPLGRIDYESNNFMKLLDAICRIYQLSNQNTVRRLIDNYDGGWHG